MPKLFHFSSVALIAVFGVTSVAIAAPPRPARTYHLENLKWHVWLKANETGFTGYVVNILKPFKRGLKQVRLDAGPMSISKISVNGTETAFEHNVDELMVNVPTADQDGRELKIEISYQDSPSAGAYFVSPDHAYPATTEVVYTQGEAEDTRYWLPTYDYPDDKALSESWITVPKGWKALGNGKLLATTDGPDGVTFHYAMNHPMATYLNSFVAGPYDVGHEHWGSLPVDYWAPQGLLSWGKAAFGGTGDIIKFYSKLTGFMYPWQKFAQTAVPDFMFGGMENASAVTQTLSALHPENDQQTEDSTGLVAHELAHQWFGDTITCKDWSNAWLNEGFATLLPTFWAREKEGENTFELDRASTLQQGLAGAEFSGHEMIWTGYRVPMDNFGGNTYPGGASRMFMLMDKLGEKRFWHSITYYLNTYKWQSVDTPTFFAAMSKASGENLTPFMKEWFYTNGAPRLDANIVGSNLVITQQKPYFDLPLEVWGYKKIDGKPGQWIKSVAQVSGASTTIPLKGMEGLPIVLDAEKRVMASITTHWKLDHDDWLSIFKDAPVATRSSMLNGGGFRGRRRGGPAAPPTTDLNATLTQPEWATLVKEEKVLAIKQQLISKLDASNQDLLLSLTQDPDARIRLAALRNLSSRFKAPVDQKVSDRINEMMTSDTNDDVKNTAFSTLLNDSIDGKLADTGWGMDSYRDAWRVDALGYWVSHDPDKAREMALLALSKPMSEPVRTRAIGALGSLKDVKGSRVVLDALLKVAGEGSFGGVSDAIRALQSYGSPEAIPIIEKLTHSDLFFVNETATAALDQMKSSAGDK